MKKPLLFSSVCYFFLYILIDQRNFIKFEHNPNSNFNLQQTLLAEPIHIFQWGMIKQRLYGLLFLFGEALRVGGGEGLDTHLPAKC